MRTFDIEEEYAKLHSSFPIYKHRPIIGITGNYDSGKCTLLEGYYRSVLEAGGTPLIVPSFDDTDAMVSVLDNVDALILSGGGDINPLYLGEEPIPELSSINPARDWQELMLVRLAANRQIPILGICRGIQVMTAALGGKLYQDIYRQAGATLKHSQDTDRHIATHSVRIASSSKLAKIFGSTNLHVNSFHHQAVQEAAPGFAVTAVSPDGLIEAVESTQCKSMIGVQWHPECMILGGDRSMMPLFEWVVGEARSFAQAREWHRQALSLDTHCDTPMKFDQKIRFDKRDPRILVDLHKMTEGHLDATIMVAYLRQMERDKASLDAAFAKADRLLNEIEEMVAHSAESVGIAYTPDDLYRLKREGRRALMLGIENGYAIGDDPTRIEYFRRRGVVYMTLCHNGDNDLCDSARGNAEHGGLSALGRKVISEMNRVGMMVDLSHAAESSFYQAIEASSTPIVCSHSSARALCDHPRNLTDDQLRALAASGGVVQTCLYDGFLRKEGGATIDDAIRHIRHMVDVAGIDHVGIGTDFDGDGGIIGCADASEVINLTRRLQAEGFSDPDIEKLWGGNFLRVMRLVQGR
ncbi:MAG: membrane dipeptidase [Bacteroidaceae bacterium]|nr:membrane dipeptidase [Bacteroidaceae bacterium]MBQ2435738.1 membrane dipeptidase [Bacteroidaceae bacterium]